MLTNDTRFAFVDVDGEQRYPYKQKQRRTGKYGFATGIDRDEKAEYLSTIEEVVKAAVLNGKRIRVRNSPPTPAKAGNGLNLHAARSVIGYRISPELRYLISNAAIQPLDEVDPSDIKDALSGKPVAVIEAEREILRDPECQNISETTRVALVDARLGQGRYRNDVAQLWGHACAVSGCSISTALIASHAKPWVESTNVERLDRYNGLFLAASIDCLFDRGLISFGSDGCLLIKPTLDFKQLELLGITPKSRLLRIFPENLPYLKNHRKRFGFE